MENNLKETLSTIKIPLWSELPELDLYMDQIIVLMEKYLGSTPNDKLITPSMINNYVKLGMMPAPIKKKYSKTHIAYLIIICSLKQVMPIPDIKILIDDRLKKASIEEVLDEYSKLYSDCKNKILETAQAEEKKDKNSNPALFLAASASICRFISEDYINKIK